jgi:hypothetical protein
MVVSLGARYHPVASARAAAALSSPGLELSAVQAQWQSLEPKIAAVTLTVAPVATGDVLKDLVRQALVRGKDPAPSIRERETRECVALCPVPCVAAPLVPCSFQPAPVPVSMLLHLELVVTAVVPCPLCPMQLVCVPIVRGGRAGPCSPCDGADPCCRRAARAVHAWIHRQRGSGISRCHCLRQPGHKQPASTLQRGVACYQDVVEFEPYLCSP